MLLDLTASFVIHGIPLPQINRVPLLVEFVDARRQSSVLSAWTQDLKKQFGEAIVEKCGWGIRMHVMTRCCP